MIRLDVSLQMPRGLDVRARSAGVPERVTRDMIDIAVSDTRRRVVNDGRGVTGARMRGYSAQYRAVRASHGRTVGHVDLTVTGQLMRSFQRIASTGGVVADARAGFVGAGTRRNMRRAGAVSRSTGTRSNAKFSGPNRTMSNALLAYYLDADRKWFGFSPDTRRRVVEYFTAWFRKWTEGQ